MHCSTWLLVLFFQTTQDGVRQPMIKDSDIIRIPSVSPHLKMQIQKKPVLQDSPPTSFVPPNNSTPSGPRFNPQGSFSAPQETQTEASTSGFSPVDPTQTKPLRSNASSFNNPPENQTESKSFQSTGGFSIDNRTDSTFNGNSSPPTIQPTASAGTVPNTKQTQTIEPLTEEQSGTDFANPTSGKISDGQPTPSAINFSDPLKLNSSPRNSNRMGENRKDDSSTNPLALNQPLAGESDAADDLASPETRIVNDETFDPQLKEISDYLLTSLRRPNFNRVSLSQVIQNARDSAQRKQMVKQYWTSFVHAADLQYARQEIQLLGSIPRPTNQLDQLVLRAATSAAKARLSEAQLASQKSARRLHQMAPVFDIGQPVSFADLPWIGKYKTNTEGFVKTGLFDEKIRKFDSALPAMRDLIYHRGAAVYDNLLAMQQAIVAHTEGQLKLDPVLRLYRETRDHRIKFLKNIENYNHAIADYAISVFPNAVRPRVVTQMLIDTAKTLPNETILDQNVRQASGSQTGIR